MVLHGLHRRQGIHQDQTDHPCVDSPPVPTTTHRRDQRGQRGIARLDVLLPPRARRTTVLLPQVFHLAKIRRLATRATPLGLETGETMAPPPNGSWNTITTPAAVLFDPTKVRIERYRYRGNRIPNPYDLTITA